MARLWSGLASQARAWFRVVLEFCHGSYLVLIANILIAWLSHFISEVLSRYGAAEFSALPIVVFLLAILIQNVIHDKKEQK